MSYYSSTNLLECMGMFLPFPAPFCVCVNAVFLLPTLTLCIAVLICPTLVSKQVMNNLNLGQTFKVNLTSCWFLQFSSGEKWVCLLVVVWSLPCSLMYFYLLILPCTLLNGLLRSFIVFHWTFPVPFTFAGALITKDIPRDFLALL